MERELFALVGMGCLSMCIAVGCASEKPKEQRPGAEDLSELASAARYVNGFVAECSEDSITIAGLSSKMEIEVSETTAYYRETAADSSVLAVGQWLIVEPRNKEGAAVAASVKVFARKPRSADIQRNEAPSGGSRNGGSGGEMPPPGMGGSDMPPPSGMGGPGMPPSGANGPEESRGGGMRSGLQPDGQTVEYRGVVTGITNTAIVMTLEKFGKTRDIRIRTSPGTLYWKMLPATKADISEREYASVMVGRGEGAGAGAFEIDLRK